jgi:transcriptional regulator with GAF, ATPase, and Fis domain
VAVGEGLSGWVAANGKPILNGNPAADADELGSLKSAIAIPLEGDHGTAGVLTLFRVHPDAFSSLHLQDLLALSPLLGQIIEPSRAHSQRTRHNVIPIAAQSASRARSLNQSLLQV